MAESLSLGIVGTGIMGSGIAELAASCGHQVVAWGRSEASVKKLLSSVEKSLARRVERGKISLEQAEAIKERITTTTDLKALDQAEVIIESVVEDLEVKKGIFARLDEVAREDALLATNTSTLSVTELASVCSRKERVVGFHFSNPPQVLPLVEVVVPEGASEHVIERAMEVARALSKEPIKVKDRAGFVLNALLFPYLNNAIRLYEMGVASREDIDAAMKGGAGFPMGPFEVLDLVGLDTSLAILETLYKEYADPNFAPQPLLRRLVATGKLGRKSGEGFYSYS